jgi:NADH-quinone oxidoreductase subunit A
MSTALVATVIVFVVAGVAFLALPLVVGWLVRPNRPSVEKGEVYECGEVPIGSAWIQFDLRFYVVALLFVIFDVEIAFFFPWAVVFGSANRAGDTQLSVEQRLEATKALTPTGSAFPEVPQPVAMHSLATFAFIDLLVFFGILLVAFAYLWRRGDLEWVRSIAAQVRQDHKGHGPPSPGMER